MNIAYNSVLARLAQGDRRAFRELFDALYVPMVQRAAYFVNDITAAEDIVQEVFINMWNTRGKLSPVANPVSYISRWVRNDCLNYIRDTDTANRYQYDYLLKQAEADDTDPQPFIEAVETLLCQLPEKRRRVVEMRVYQSKSYPQIAEELDISLNTVKDHLKKAYAFLREKAASVAGNK